MEMAWGQNNRWTYCANDPVNVSDPSGEFFQLIGDVLFVTGSIMAIMGSLNNDRGMFIAGSVMAIIGGLMLAGPTFLLQAWSQLMRLMTLLAALFGVVWKSTCLINNSLQEVADDFFVNLFKLLGGR